MRELACVAPDGWVFKNYKFITELDFGAPCFYGVLFFGKRKAGEVGCDGSGDPCLIFWECENRKREAFDVMGSEYPMFVLDAVLKGMMRDIITRELVRKFAKKHGFKQCVLCDGEYNQRWFGVRDDEDMFSLLAKYNASEYSVFRF